MLRIAIISILLNICYTEDTCEVNKECLSEDPHLEEITNWLKNLQDHKIETYSEKVSENAPKLIEIVSCDDPNGVWNYKYTGTKGKRKIFKGKGKLVFTKKGDAPHGYDYGMKTGHCLKRHDLEIKSIEGDFDDKGVLQGVVKVDYFDGKRIFGQVVDNILHGLTKTFVDEIDEETNLPKMDKKLSLVQLFHSNEPVGNHWHFSLNGMVVFKEENVQEAVLFGMFIKEYRGCVMQEIGTKQLTCNP